MSFNRPRALPRNYPCPCRSSEVDALAYAVCCRPLHDGLESGVHAPTPEALMRSRYSAYVVGLIDYLLGRPGIHRPHRESSNYRQ